MKALEFLRTIPEWQILQAKIHVIERVGFVEEMTPQIVFSTKQGLNKKPPIPCWYLEICVDLDGKGIFCTHKKSFINKKQDDNFDDQNEHKERLAKEMLHELVMGGIFNSYQFLITK